MATVDTGMDVVGGAWYRAEVLRALYTVAAGVPTLTLAEACATAAPRLTARDLRLLDAVGTEDLALLNACLSAEATIREDKFSTLERLLFYCQFGEGSLDARILALPDRAFAGAALGLYELGWIDGGGK